MTNRLSIFQITFIYLKIFQSCFVNVNHLCEHQVMEYLNGGPLLDVICSYVRYTEENVKEIIFQLIE